MTARTTRRVYFSSSQNIFENLALEDYLYQNENFEGQSLLLLWINSPSVVIGRHQNPWIEVNLNELMQKNVAFSRRNSGGGAVYHDIGKILLFIYLYLNLKLCIIKIISKFRKLKLYFFLMSIKVQQKTKS